MANKEVLSVLAFLMAFFVCQFGAAVKDKEEAAILAELEKSPMENADLGEIFFESGDLSHRFGMKDIITKLEDMCKCEGLVCYCCETPSIVGVSFHACVNITMYPTERLIGFGAGVSAAKVFKNISMNSLDQFCQSLPLPFLLSHFKLCMYNTWTGVSSQNTITTCSSLDIQYIFTTIATIEFHCLELKDGRVSFVIPEESPDRSPIMSFRMKNPLKSLALWLKKKYASSSAEGGEKSDKDNLTPEELNGRPATKKFMGFFGKIKAWFKDKLRG